MPRIRTLKPEALTHRKVGKLDDRCFRLWIACLTQADDDGRLVFDPAQMRLLVWGYHPKIRSRDTWRALLGLVEAGLVRGYTVENGDQPTTYVDFPSWNDHQRVDHPRRSQLPKWTPAGSQAFSVLVKAREGSRGFARILGGSEGSEGSRRIGPDARAREGKDGARAPGQPVDRIRSSLSGGPDGGDATRGGDGPARAVALTGSGPLAGTLSHVLAAIPPMGFVPRGAGAPEAP